MKQQDKAPLISVITVVYNAADFLEATLKSVIEQEYDSFEYIIVDGGSTDGTLDIVRRYEDRVDYWVSEPDKGIYDAMNKAVLKTRGHYINFMNAGDSFYSSKVLKNVANEIKSRKNIDILYGNAVKKSSEASGFLYETGRPLTTRSFFMTTPMCHQSMFTHRDLFSTVGPYSREYKAASFCGWLAKYYALRQNLNHIVYLPMPLSIYLDGGYSFQVKKVIERERLSIAKEYYPLKYKILHHFRYPVEYVKSVLLPIMLRMQVLDRYREIKYKLLGKAIAAK
ncbi:glycosyltransferase family 2 protein [Pontibacter sp. CAU 1760]